MTNNKMFKILNTNYCLETHDQSQQSKAFCFPLRVSTVSFLTTANKRMANLQSLRLRVGYIPLDLDNAPCLTKGRITLRSGHIA